MGVNGLTKLIKSDNRFLIKNYRLHNVKLVIDANNLARVLLEKVEYEDRTDRVGVNLVAYGKQVELLFDNLRKCKIEPVLVFDGVQTNAVTSTTTKKTEKITENLGYVEKLISSSKNDRLPVVHPACTNMILKSIAIEKQVHVAQCFSEGEKYVAKVANDFDGFVLSGDSDFFILEVKRGVILLESLEFKDIKEQSGEEQSGDKIQSQFYIECDLFDQSHFLKSFPGLDKSCLPLFAGIAGNDVSGRELYFLLLLVPRNLASSKDGRLTMLLKFLCNKSLEQSIDSLIALVEAKRREKLEASIRDSIRYYHLPEEDDFDKEISEHYKENFCETYSSKFDDDPVKVGTVAEREIRLLSHWLRKKIETSNLTKNCLELALRNIVFLRPEMDNFTKSSAHNCIKSYRSVLLTLMRSSHADNLPCSFYDREGDSIKMFKLEPLLELEKCGPMDNLIFDVCDDLSDDIVTTKLTQSERTAILLATFDSSPVEFLNSEAPHEDFLEPQHSEEFAVLKLLLEYVELEENVYLRPRFFESVLVTYLYYLHFGEAEAKTNIPDDANESYLGFLDNLKQLTRENHLEDINQWTISDYDITTVRNIVQVQAAIIAYEELNAFLGTTLPTLRMHKWFNSSFIYNFAATVKREHLQMPSIVDDLTSVRRNA